MVETPDWEDEDARSTPVNGDRCLWCKCSPVENPTQLASGEILCGACLGDLREWKRTRFADLLAAPTVEETVLTALLTEWRDLRDLIADIHHDDQEVKTLPTRTSNAHERRIHDDTPRSGEDS